MALGFDKIEGSAKKGSYYKLKDGVNTFRIVGDILPRYLYWVTNSKGETLPFECLGFDRNKEKFTNVEEDHVQKNVKVKNKETGEMESIKCSWAYVAQIVQPDGKLEILNLKKKMFEAILAHAKKKGDPTDPETGYDIVVERVKTGPHNFNVEYRLDPVAMLEAGPRPLTEQEREGLKELKPIDEVVPRATPEEQKEQLEAFLSGESDTGKKENTNTDKEAVNDL